MVFSAVERMIAFRYLRARRRETFISVIAWFSLLGIMLGVATLIVVMSVMNGFRIELVDRILGISGHIRIEEPGGLLQDADPLAASLLRQPEIRSAAPIIEGQVLAASSGRSQGAVVRGMRSADIAARGVLTDALVAGSLDSYDAGQSVLIGVRLARALGVTIGDRLTLVSPSGRATVFGTVPRSAAYTIVGLFDVGMSEIDSGVIFMPLDVAMAYFATGGGVSAVEVLLHDPRAVSDGRRAVAAALPPPHLLVRDWQQINSSLVGALVVERNVMFIILSLIILVAAFNIISGLTMLVRDKAADIAILRTMGATRGMIQRIFFMSGASIGLVGTGLGVTLGIVFADNIEFLRTLVEAVTGSQVFPPEVYFLTRLPSVIQTGDVVLAGGMALALSFLATLYPAWRAARLDPVEALRRE